MANYNLFDAASLAMIPTGVKEDKLYSIKPTDGSGDFTFSRGSDIQSTRVNASGLIEKAKENLLLQSNVFNVSPWASASMTLTSGQTGYDGSSDAWLIDSTGGYTFQGLSLSGVYTYSIYAKKGTADGIRLRMDAATDANAYISLTDGSESLPTSGIGYTATSVGGGWWRISVSINDSSLQNVRFYAIDSSGNSTTGTIYIQDAQLNHGLIAQDYVETTTTAVVEGLTADLPRLDYSGGASCPSLLLEPSRTNLFTYSEYFGGWSLGGTTTPTLTANYATSPEGVDNAYRVQLPNLATDSVLFQLISHTTGFDMSISAWVKSASGSNESFKLYGDYGTSTGRSATLTATNEWQRFEFTYTATATGNRGAGLINVQNTAADLLVYGFQIEQASYPTSLIPTYGTAANRGADSASKTGISSLIGQTEGTLFFEGSSDTIGGSTNLINFNFAANSVVINRQSSGIIRAIINTASAILLDSSPVSGTFKVAIGYKNGDSVLYVNGTLAASSTNSFTFATALTEVNLGTGVAYFAAVNQSKCNQALVFKTRLTNAELAALTTI